ncbi:hypothetical protein RY831_32310, partial [Noviherbaspirillum sp. CPCC 100848]
MWKRQWQQVIPFFAYPPEVRTIIYTTDEIDNDFVRGCVSKTHLLKFGHNRIRPADLVFFRSAGVRS